MTISCEYCKNKALRAIELKNQQINETIPERSNGFRLLSSVLLSCRTRTRLVVIRVLSR